MSGKQSNSSKKSNSTNNIKNSEAKEKKGKIQAFKITFNFKTWKKRGQPKT